MSTDGAGAADRVGPAARAVIGRAAQVDLLQAALDAGLHVVLEGPPGTGKSTLLRAVARRRAVGCCFVEGTAELTPSRLVGHFDPALVLARGYSPEVFVDGPLLRAMRRGELLYVEELNRVPAQTLNVLLTAMSEREVAVPRLGTVAAADDFRFVAAMNPYDAVGTERISGALSDRTCRITMGYQSADDECEIVRRSPGVSTPDQDWLRRVVTLVRSTRSHPDLRFGSSVRGAIDMVKMAQALAIRRREPLARVGLDAALVSLTGRVQVARGGERRADQIITELYLRHVAGDDGGRDRAEDDSPGQPGACRPQRCGRQAPHSRPARPRSRPEDRMMSRHELAYSAAFERISPEAGRFDDDALRGAMSDDVRGTIALLARMSRATDGSLRAAARRLSARLVLDHVTRSGVGRDGVGRLARSIGEAEGDLDVDASLDHLVAARAAGTPVDADQLVTSHWARGTLALILVIDRSGSMSGDRLADACILAAACAMRRPDELGVLAFAGRVGILHDLHDRSPTADLIDKVLHLVAHGETGLSGALRAAADVAAGSTADHRVVILMSDCRASGADDRAVEIASALDELVVVAPAEDCDVADDFARRSGARCVPVTTWEDVASVSWLLYDEAGGVSASKATAHR